MAEGRITISNKLKLFVIARDGAKCNICRKPGFVYKGRNKVSIFEEETYKKPINVYDGIFIEAHLSMEFDHIIPLINKGQNNAENIEILCRNCNRKKGRKDLKIFLNKES